MENLFDLQRFVNYCKLLFTEKKWRILILFGVVNVFLILIYNSNLRNYPSIVFVQSLSKFIIFAGLPLLYTISISPNFREVSKSVFFLTIPVSYLEIWLSSICYLLILIPLHWFFLKIIDFTFLTYIINNYNQLDYPQYFESIKVLKPIGLNNDAKGVKWSISLLPCILNLPFVGIIFNIFFSDSTNKKVKIVIPLFFFYIMYGQSWIYSIVVGMPIKFSNFDFVQVLYKKPSNFINIELPSSLILLNQGFLYFILPVSLLIISIIALKEKELGK